MQNQRSETSGGSWLGGGGDAYESNIWGAVIGGVVGTVPGYFIGVFLFGLG